jgi:ComF family protein
VVKTNGEPCAGCARGSSLDKISACFHYREYDAVGKLIKAFKYRYSTDIHNVWREVLISPAFEHTDATVIPVPLHGRRERERGFNQAQHIAQVLAQRYNLSLNAQSLRRVRHTAQQAKLGRMGRIANMKGAFEWHGTNVPKNIILVDDVYTTGATMQECARVLKLAGAQKVEGFVIARG